MPKSLTLTCTFALLLSLAFSASAMAATYDCSPFQLPAGNVVRQTGGINNAGTVSGSYNDSSGQTHGFIYNPSSGSFLSVDYPGASLMSLFNINNNGVSVGQATTSNGNVFFTLDSSGNFHPIPVASGYTISSVFGIDDSGDISAVVQDSVGTFIYAVIRADGTVLNYGSNPVHVGSLNNSLQVIENSTSTAAVVDSSGNITRLQDPIFADMQQSNDTITLGTGVNNAGTVMGPVSDQFLPSRTYTRDASGVYSEVFCPNLTINAAVHAWNGINDNGVLISNETIATPLPGLAQATLPASGIQFPPTPVGQPSPPQSLTIANSGNARLDIASVQIIQPFEGGPPFTVSGCAGGVISLDPGASCTLTLNATPKLNGVQYGTLVIEDSAPGGPHLRSLTSIGESSAPPPTCSVSGTNPGPPAQVTFTMQDSTYGLASISVVQTTNATANVPSFPYGTTSPVYASATQIDTSRASSVSFSVNNTNTYSSTTTCSQQFGGPPYGWMGLGGSITGRISVIGNSNGTLQAFARGTDNALWTLAQTSPDGPWGTWQSLGDGLASDPAVAKNGNGLLEIFVLGGDSSLWEASQSEPNGAFNWQELGQNFTGDPAAAVNANGTVQVFAVGSDQALWTTSEMAPGATWSGWTSLGGTIFNSPAAITNTNGSVEAFVIAAGNTVWHIWQSSPGGVWSSWDELGGSIAGNPVAVMNSSNGLVEVFGLGTDSAIWNISHPWGSGWSGWTSLGGSLISDPAAVFEADGSTEVLARASDNGLWTTSTTSGNPLPGSPPWSNWAPLGGTLANGPSAAVNQDGRVSVFVEGTDTTMWTYAGANAAP
ncbi:MAG TPA: choice-of-anchor D domain-containing protein [Bryobacteraceae bacterium]|jgi:hypothetical protein|nr:choice-of-anchor D domain-containing protein [Bryobacteraceae bacterium]